MAFACPFSDHPVGTGTFCRICGRSYIQVADPVLPETPERELVSVGTSPVAAAEAGPVPPAWVPAHAAGLVPEEPFTLDVAPGMTFELASAFADLSVPAAVEQDVVEQAVVEQDAVEQAVVEQAVDEPDGAEPGPRERSQALLVGVGVGAGAALMAVLDRLVL